MANTLKVKRSNVDGKIPTTSDLGSGELGVNMADRKIYINNGTYIVQVGSGTLEGLADVNVLTPVAGDALVYTGTQWVNTDRVNAKTIYETVKNVSGTTLTKGTPVYQVGTSGNSVTVGAARADDPAKPAVGVLDETTADQAEGRMLVLGEIKGVDTSTFVTGDKIYLGASGGYTNVPPATAAHQFLGVVFRVDANSGSGYITGTLLPDVVRWTGTALEAWTGTAWVAVGGGGGEVTLDGVQTLANKRINPRLNSQSSDNTITPSANTQDQLNITALAVSATIATPTGTPVDGQKLMLRIEDNGTPRALSWSSSYRPIGVTLPTTTTALKTMYIGMIYNSQDSFWDVIAVAIQA